MKYLAFLIELLTLSIASLANAISLSHEIPISTAINEQREPAVALDPVNHRFLVVWSDVRRSSSWHVYGQIVNSDGTLFGNNFSISTGLGYHGGNPNVAYDPVNRRFLVIWTEGFVPHAIYGRFVGPTGQLQESEILISTTTEYIRRPIIAYDAGNKRFLICWDGMDPKNEGGDYVSTEIFIRLINTDGSFLGKENSINPGNSLDPTVAYDSLNQRYFVLWSGSGTESHFYNIYGRLLNTEGTLFGNKFIISATPHNHFRPIVFYDNKNQSFFVLWDDIRIQGKHGVYGQFVNANGILLGTEFLVSTTIKNGLSSAAYDPEGQRFLIVTSNEKIGLYGRVINTDGRFIVNVFTITYGPSLRQSATIYDSINQRFFVVWSSYGMQSSLDRTGINIYGKFISIDDEGTSIGHWGIGILTMSHNEILIFLSAFIFLVVFSILFILWRKRIVSR